MPSFRFGSRWGVSCGSDRSLRFHCYRSLDPRLNGASIREAHDLHRTLVTYTDNARWGCVRHSIHPLGSSNLPLGSVRVPLKSDRIPSVLPAKSLDFPIEWYLYPGGPRSAQDICCGTLRVHARSCPPFNSTFQGNPLAIAIGTSFLRSLWSPLCDQPLPYTPGCAKFEASRLVEFVLC